MMTTIVDIAARAPRHAEQLERQRERDGDDSDVQPGDREDVRQPGGGKAVAHLRRELAPVGDEQRADERRVVAETCGRCAAGGRAPPAQQRADRARASIVACCMSSPRCDANDCAARDDGAPARARRRARTDSDTAPSTRRRARAHERARAALSSSEHERRPCAASRETTLVGRRVATRDDGPGRRPARRVRTATPRAARHPTPCAAATRERSEEPANRRSRRAVRRRTRRARWRREACDAKSALASRRASPPSFALRHRRDVRPAIGSGWRSRTTWPVNVEPVVPVSSTLRYLPIIVASPGNEHGLEVARARLQQIAAAPRLLLDEHFVAAGRAAACSSRARCRASSSTSAASRSLATSSGTVSSARHARGRRALARRELERERHRRIRPRARRSSVSSKSSSVSPGNPTMMSVVTRQPGNRRAQRARRTRDSLRACSAAACA